MTKQTVSYYLDQKYIDYIEAQAERNGGSTASAGLRFILDEAMRRDAMLQKVYAENTILGQVKKAIEQVEPREGKVFLRDVCDQMNKNISDGPHQVNVRYIVQNVKKLGYTPIRSDEGFYIEPVDELVTA